MSLILHQAPDDGTNGIVTPESDARLYALATANACGIVQGVQVTSIGGSSLQVSSGWGVVFGRCFTVEQETILAETSTGKSKKGRLLIRIDLSAAEQPIKFITQVADVLPALTQEDINAGGAIYELPLAEYSVNEISVSDLVNVSPKAQSLGANLGDLDADVDKLRTDVNHLKYVYVSLPYSGWSDSAPYTQTVSVPDMTADWVPGIPFIVFWSNNVPLDTLRNGTEALGYIKMITSAEGTLTFTAPDDQPRVNLSLRVPGMVGR